MTFTRFARAARITLLAWLAVLGFDFFLHGGLLADFYRRPDPFLLPESELFRRIPIGYLSFLIQIILLHWVLVLGGVASARRGALYGLAFGVLLGGGFLLGLISVANVPPWLLLAWFAGQSVELVVGGAVLGAGLRRDGLGGLVWAVLSWVLVCLIAGVVLQNL